MDTFAQYYGYVHAKRSFVCSLLLSEYYRWELRIVRQSRNQSYSFKWLAGFWILLQDSELISAAAFCLHKSVTRYQRLITLIPERRYVAASRYAFIQVDAGCFGCYQREQDTLCGLLWGKTRRYNTCWGHYRTLLASFINIISPNLYFSLRLNYYIFLFCN